MKPPAALWGPLEIASWQNVPHIAGRVANESDVKQGRAVFFAARQNGSRSSARPHPLAIPSCAIFHPQPPDLESIPVLIVQAEEVDGRVLLGYRPITGGNGICTLAEVELLSGPDERFGGVTGHEADV